MTLEEFLLALRRAHDGALPLDEDQRRAVEHDFRSPLWIIAGPGTGKTHTLSWLTLKRILVDDIDPHRIMLTTFTRKAAAELESRLLEDRQRLLDAGAAQAARIEVPHIYLDTLHGLCSRILQDLRYAPTLRIRVLEDELAQQFFIRRSGNLLLECDDTSFWQRFGMAVKRGSAVFVPARARKAEACCKLFNRMTENSVDLQAMRSSGDSHLTLLAMAYEQYQASLREGHRTDQAHLQRHFLDFLATDAGRAWLGDGLTVLVDEYQDTNPIQEQIYFTLAGARGDLTVVGDDDQSLYRFRGATVESLINFDVACMRRLRRSPTPINLHENRRSHEDIVGWVNRYIRHHPKMIDPQVRVRAPNKQDLIPRACIGGRYPAVMAIVERDNPSAAKKVAGAICQLHDEGLIEDYSQVALLSLSTRETSHSIGTFVDRLRTAGIPVYNPRSGRAQKDPLFRALVGGLAEILDPAGEATLPVQIPRSVSDYVAEARKTLRALLDDTSHGELSRYIESSAGAIRAAHCDDSRGHVYLTRKGGRRVTISGLLYKLLSHEPFVSGLRDPEAGERLKALSLVLSEYEALYDNGELRLERNIDGRMRVERWTLYNFYAVLVEGIHDRLNDPEDDDVSIQPGMVNVMTVHQSKGLEFEVVFVLRPDLKPWISDTHIMEDELDPFVRRVVAPPRRRSRELRADEDFVRLFFVAYSRAKRLLVIAGSKPERWCLALGHDVAGLPLNSRERLKDQGVHIL